MEQTTETQTTEQQQPETPATNEQPTTDAPPPAKEETEAVQQPPEENPAAGEPSQEQPLPPPPSGGDDSALMEKLDDVIKVIKEQHPAEVTKHILATQNLYVKQEITSGDVLISTLLSFLIIVQLIKFVHGLITGRRG